MNETYLVAGRTTSGWAVLLGDIKTLKEALKYAEFYGEIYKEVHVYREVCDASKI